MSIGATKVQAQLYNNSTTVRNSFSFGQIMASQAHSGGTATSVAQQNAQNVGQQLQLQQSTTTTTIQGAHQAGNPNQMQPLQVIQQQLQNPTLMPHQFYNTQGQLLMPGNIAFHPGLNPQLQQAQLNPTIQVIAAGKTLQSNQLSAPHMFTSSYTIPTSASNNQAYIIGHPSILQQQQTTKPGEMQKVIQPQLGTTAQIPQGIWAIPQFLNQNPILIRGTQPDQMFIQQQQPLHNNTSTHQHFTTMPLTAGQLPATSISSATTNGVQQVTQQQQQQVQQNHQQQSQQGQSQAQTQIATSNLVSIKAPATLQPKPPLQIQPQPAQNQNANQNQQHQSQQNQQAQAQQQQQQHNQQLQQQAQQLQSQLQQVTMAHQQQVQMIHQPTATSQQQNMLQQQILAQNTQALTAQVMQQAQQGLQQAPRQLTILPQGATQQIQPQQMTLIQQQPQQQQTQQPQPIRPNYSTASASNATTGTQQQGLTTTAGMPRGKINRKPGVGRGNASASPTQQAKMFPRPTIPTSVSPCPPQLKPAPSQQQVGATLTKVQIPAQGSNSQSSPVNNQPLKTINLAALHTPPNLPDATLTPLIPQSGSQTQSIQQAPSQPVQVFPAAATQLPSPNISITPAPPPMKKDDTSNENVTPQTPQTPSQQQQQNNAQAQHGSEAKSENEKENAKTETSTDDSEDGSGKQKLPKAMVKPQVLTHVIEGFVIQEASEPFPLGRNGDSDEPPMKKVALSGEMGKCEMCGKVDLRSKFKKNKRFCSSQCAKGMKAQQHQSHQSIQPPSSVPNPSANSKINDNHVKSKGKKLGEGDSELTDETSSSIGEPSYMSPSNDQPDDEPKVNPVKWNVSEVVDFVRSLPGCAEYADDFALQEIDGQALMLLKEDHLMSAMNMKLGPALKLCAKIEVIKAGMSANGDSNQSKS